MNLRLPSLSMHAAHARLGLAALLLCVLAGCATQAPVAVAPPAPLPKAKPKIALALGGGAARGFAHIGVIKVLEQNGIVPDMVVGTSAGSLVGALYAGGFTPFGLQRLALEMDEGMFADWSFKGASRGLIKGEALEAFVNARLANLPMEKLPKAFGVVATDLQSGESIVFRTGNIGIAVHASSAVPGAFRPVAISGREYVDGGLSHPVPVRAARAMGADIVIAVDISQKPGNQKAEDLGGIFLQTFAIMGQSIARGELAEADVVIHPLSIASGANFAARHEAMLEGEKAAWAALPQIRERLARLRGEDSLKDRAAGTARGD